MAEKDSKFWLVVTLIAGYLVWQPYLLRDAIIKCVDRAVNLEEAQYCARES